MSAAAQPAAGPSGRLVGARGFESDDTSVPDVANRREITAETATKDDERRRDVSALPATSDDAIRVAPSARAQERLTPTASYRLGELTPFGTELGWMRSRPVASKCLTPPRPPRLLTKTS